MTNKTPINFVEELRTNWMLILFIGGLIVGWTTINARITQAENEIDKLSQVVQEINHININLAKIQTDVEYIKIIIKQN